MRNTLFTALSIVILGILLAPTPVLSEESGSVVEVSGESHHGTIARGTGEMTDPAKMGEMTEKTLSCIERRRNKHSVDGSHPWVPPLPETVSAPDVLPGPHGPATPPVSVERGGLSPLTMFTNTEIAGNSNVPVNTRGNVPEPTAYMAGDEVFYTANWYAAKSTDGGDTFAYVNPFVGPFADPAGEDMCCDQTSEYDPGTNTAFWLQMYITANTNTPSTGTQRINVDQGADGTWDCYYDITAQDMGWGADRWLDFPDLAASSNYLWLTSNVFTAAQTFDMAFAARFPLSELASCSATLNFDNRTANYFSLRLARGMTTTGYYGTHYSQTQLRVAQWPDADATPTWKAAITGYWSNAGTASCPGPDGRDWCGRQDTRIQSGWVADGVIGFMWAAPQNAAGGFPFPYTRVARFNEADMSHIDDVDIWSPDVAYLYPSVAVNSQGDLGGTIMWGGGGTYYNNCSVWIADDVNGGVLSPLEHVVSIQGTSGPRTNEGGDYTMTRMASPNSTRYVGACYGNLSEWRSSSMFVYFGRELPPDIFSDGFESGDITNWN